MIQNSKADIVYIFIIIIILCIYIHIFLHISSCYSDPSSLPLYYILLYVNAFSESPQSIHYTLHIKYNRSFLAKKNTQVTYKTWYEKTPKALEPRTVYENTRFPACMLDIHYELKTSIFLFVNYHFTDVIITCYSQIKRIYIMWNYVEKKKRV